MVHWDAAAVLLVREGAVLGLFWGVKASLPGNLDLPIWLNDYHWSFNGLAGAASEGVSGAAAGAGQREEVLAARAPNSPAASCARAEDRDADIHQCRGYHGYWQGRSYYDDCVLSS